VFESAGIGEAAQTLIRLSWVSRYGDVKERSLYKVISHKLTLDGTSSVAYSRLLRDDAVFYKQIRDGETTDRKERDIWLAVTTLRAQSAYALLIAASRSLGEPARRRLSTALFSLIVRFNIISDKDRARFETTMFTAAKTISDGAGEGAALALLRGLSPTDDEIRQNFLTLNFGRAQAGIVQVLLRAFEYNLRDTEELIIATPEKVHVEHIYPQKPPPAARLANHDECIGRIGNLTLLDHRMNQEAQNSGFVEKRDRWYRDSALYLTQELLAKNAWAPADIDARQQQLCDRALQIWPHSLVAN
jgi:hypothetical protein